MNRNRDRIRRPSWSEWLRAMPSLAPILIEGHILRIRDDLADAVADGLAAIRGRRRRLDVAPARLVGPHLTPHPHPPLGGPP